MTWMVTGGAGYIGAHVVRALGDTASVMDGGRVVHAGPMAVLAGDAALQQRLLGLSLDTQP